MAKSLVGTVTFLTAEDVLARLAGEVDRAGSRSALARRWRIHRSVIDDAVNDGKLTPTVLKKLRVEPQTTYRTRIRFERKSR